MLQKVLYFSILSLKILNLEKSAYKRNTLKSGVLGQKLLTDLYQALPKILFTWSEFYTAIFLIFILF